MKLTPLSYRRLADDFEQLWLAMAQHLDIMETLMYCRGARDNMGATWMIADLRIAPKHWKFRGVLKAGASFGCLGWLIGTGKLDLSQLATAYKDSVIVGTAAAVWAIAIIFLASWRWRYLLKGIDVSMDLRYACQLTSVGVFFNTIFAGTVGGDFVRGFYACRAFRHHGRAQVATSVLLDRVCGLYGLFIVGMIGVVSNYQDVVTHRPLRTTSLFVSGVFLILTAFISTIFIPGESKAGLFMKRIMQQRFVPRSLRRIHDVFGLFGKKRGLLVVAVGLSVAIQGLIVLLYAIVALRISGPYLDLSRQAIAVSIGSLVTALPISPGGLGVGHAAFERLYTLLGASHGANVFNAVVLGQMALNCSGVFPYLALRMSGTQPSSFKGN